MLGDRRPKHATPVIKVQENKSTSREKLKNDAKMASIYLS